MAQPLAPQWDAPLQQLLAEGRIDGYALLDHTGSCLASYGQLGDELWSSAGAQEPSPAARQFMALFNAAAQADHLTVCGQQAVIVQQSDCSVYAVSWGKALGVTAHYLPCGVLVTTFSKPSLPQTVAPLLEAICDRLRQP